MGAINPQPDELEYCSECGEFKSLIDETGWCYECSDRLGYIAPSCPSCGEATPTGKLCSHCKYVQWLERNADAIETIMAMQGVSLRTAIRTVRINNRPICQSCGQRIKGGQRGRHYFCKKNPECIKGHRTFEYYLRSKPRKEALELAITASCIFKLTAEISNRNLSK